MAEIDLEVVRKLADSAGRRALHCRNQANAHKPIDECGCSMELAYTCTYHGELNDFFYWSGKATSYRGMIAMVELQSIVDDELDSEGSCP